MMLINAPLQGVGRRARELFRDESGGLSVVSQILLTVVLAIGGIVGLATLRDQVVQEFGDVAVGLESLDQSFTTPDSLYGSYADDGTALTDNSAAEPAALSVQGAASGE